jgi:hypothetical protein
MARCATCAHEVPGHRPDCLLAAALRRRRMLTRRRSAIRALCRTIAALTLGVLLVAATSVHF